LRWPRSQDEIISRCVHVLGSVYRKQEKLPARVVSAQQFCTSSRHQARGTASLCMNTRCVLQQDSSENDEVLKPTLFFPCGTIFRTALNMHSICFLSFAHNIPYIPSCGAHKQFGAEPAQYGLEINFKTKLLNTLLIFQTKLF